MQWLTGCEHCSQVILQFVLQLTREPSRSDADRAITQFRLLSGLLLALFLSYAALLSRRAFCWLWERAFSTRRLDGDDIGTGEADDETTTKSGYLYHRFTEEARVTSILNTGLRR